MQAAAAAITVAHNAGQSNAQASAAGSQAGWAVLEPTPSMGYEGFPTAIPYAPLIPPAPSGAQPPAPQNIVQTISGIAGAVGDLLGTDRTFPAQTAEDIQKLTCAPSPPVQQTDSLANITAGYLGISIPEPQSWQQTLQSLNKPAGVVIMTGAGIAAAFTVAPITVAPIIVATAACPPLGAGLGYLAIPALSGEAFVFKYGYDVYKSN